MGFKLRTMQLAEYHLNNSNIEKCFKNAGYFCQSFQVQKCFMFVHKEKFVIM